MLRAPVAENDDGHLSHTPSARIHHTIRRRKKNDPAQLPRYCCTRERSSRTSLYGPCEYLGILVTTQHPSMTVRRSMDGATTHENCCHFGNFVYVHQCAILCLSSPLPMIGGDGAVVVCAVPLARRHLTLFSPFSQSGSVCCSRRRCCRGRSPSSGFSLGQVYQHWRN